MESSVCVEEPGKGPEITVDVKLYCEPIFYAHENNQTNKQTIQYRDEELRAS